MSRRRSTRRAGDFAAAVEKSQEPIAHGLRDGKQALEREHAQKVQCADEKRWSGSIDLDAALAQKAQFAGLNR